MRVIGDIREILNKRTSNTNIQYCPSALYQCQTFRGYQQSSALGTIMSKPPSSRTRETR